VPGSPEIVVVSNVTEDGRPIGVHRAGENWHSDMCYALRPPHGTMLYALMAGGAGNEPSRYGKCADTTTATAGRLMLGEFRSVAVRQRRRPPSAFGSTPPPPPKVIGLVLRRVIQLRVVGSLLCGGWALEIFDSVGC
jgi:Taurine catabolism dioxygenase TauD, TfdA family